MIRQLFRRFDIFADPKNAPHEAKIGAPASILCILSLVLIALSADPTWASAAKSLEFDLHDSKVDFLSIGHPAAIKIHGEGSGLQGRMTVVNKVATGRLVFDLDSLDTDIALRNEHMKEKYLETAKFKNAELEIKELKLPEAALRSDASSISVPFSGVLSLHGSKHPIQGTSEVHFTKNNLSGEAEFEIKLSDYKIEIPTYMGITVADVVKVTVDFSADEKENVE